MNVSSLSRLSDRVTAIALWVTLLGTLGADTVAGVMGRHTPPGLVDGIHAAAWTGITIFMVLAWPKLKRGGRIFLVISVLLMICTVLFADNPRHALALAYGKAIFVATLFAALGFLREAAETSGLVRRCGEFLAAQPPGRRYLALSIGGHLFGLILNFGCIALLGTLINKATGTEPLDDPMEEFRRQRRQQRMMTAIHRGFATILVWSPMTVSTAVVLSAVPNATWGEIAPWGFGTGMGLMAIGWLLDRMAKIPPGVQRTQWTATGSWLVLLPICGLVASVFIVGGLLQWLLSVRLVMGVMMAAPVVAIAWLMAQTFSVKVTAQRVIGHGWRVFPRYRGEVVLLGSAAFIGSMVSTLLPQELVVAALNMIPLPSWGMLGLIATVIVALGQAGLNPILSVTVFAGALPPPEVLGVPSPALSITLAGAWALTAASSPFGAASLVIGSMTGVGSFTAGTKWNGAFAIFGLLFITLLTALVVHIGAK